MRALDDMEEMRIDGVGDEALTVVVPIDAPGIGAAVGIGFPDMTHGMVSPDAAVEARAFFSRRAGFAGRGPVGSPVRGIQPAVRPPGETVGEVVGIGVVAEAVEQDLRS